MRATLAICLAFAACGSSGSGGPTRQPGPGEGTTCSYPDGGCPDSLTCTNWSPYQNPLGVCRLPCSAGCLSGETCGNDSTCQCAPAGFPGGTGDSCIAVGLTCHPDFRVCVGTQSSTTCPQNLVYSKAWQLCRPAGS